jgi:hypothetical protein
MLTRRGFAACALCAVTGFLATGAEAQSAPAALKRTIIKRTDGPMDGYETVNVRVDLDAGRWPLATPIRGLNPAMSSKVRWN